MTVQDRAARALARVHSVLFRLVVSYAALVLVVSVAVSGVAYLYFQGEYNEELENFHGLYLKNIEKELRSRLADSSKAAYMEVANLLGQAEGPLFGPEDSVAARSGRIYSTFVYLGNLAARDSEGIEAIHLYYAKSGLLVSSSGSSAEGGNELVGRGRAWLEVLAEEGASSAWLPYARPAYYGIPETRLFRALRCFPILSTPSDASVVVCIDYRVDLVRGILERLQPADSGSTVLIRSGFPEPVGAGAVPAFEPAVEAALRRLVAGEGPALRSGVVGTGEGRVLLTAMPFADTGWHLVNAVKASSLYRKGAGIRTTLALICLASILVGLAVSAFLSSRIYNPLGRLVGRVRSLFGPPAPEGGAVDEYEAIDSALDGISTRMGKLEAAIEAYRPAIKNELLLRLLEGEPVEPEESREALALLGASEPPARLGTALAVLPAEAGADPGEEGRRLLKYRAAGGLEEGFPGRILACVLPGRRVGLILAFAGAEAEDRPALLEACAARLRELSPGGSVLAAGPAVPSTELLAASFATARRLAEYRFLFPGLGLIADRPDLLARSGRSALPDAGFLAAVEACAASRDLPALRAQLLRLAQSARSGDCDARACRNDLELAGRHILAAASGVGLEADPSLERNLRELLAESESLDACLEELLGVAADLCATDGDPRQQRGSALAAKVRDYVKANLAGDLSLSRVSEAVAMSPGYMCKVFKDATGSSFLSYVKEVRIAEAARLLVEGREPVQDIGRRTGFNTPAYFIRVFKGRFGQTPLEYRRSRSGTGKSA